LREFVRLVQNIAMDAYGQKEQEASLALVDDLVAHERQTFSTGFHRGYDDVLRRVRDDPEHQLPDVEPRADGSNLVDEVDLSELLGSSLKRRYIDGVWRASDHAPRASRQGLASLLGGMGESTAPADVLAQVTTWSWLRGRVEAAESILSRYIKTDPTQARDAARLMLADARAVGDQRSSATAEVVLTSLESDSKQVYALYSTALATFLQRGESGYAAQAMVGQAMTTFDRVTRMARSEGAWRLCQTTTNPELRGHLTDQLVLLLLPQADPRIPKLFEETLAYADKYPDDESAWVRPRMLELAEESLAEARKNLHRARSTRDKEAARRWDVLERRLEKLLRGRKA
jgi:hypothetical protein